MKKFISIVCLFLIALVSVGSEEVKSDTVNVDCAQVIVWEDMTPTNIIVSDSLIVFSLENLTLPIKVVKGKMVPTGQLYLDTRHYNVFLYNRSKQYVTRFEPGGKQITYYLKN